MPITKEKLSEQLVKAMKKSVEDFVSQTSPEATEAQAAYDELEKEKAKVTKALGEGVATDAALKALDKEQSKLDLDDKKGTANNRKHAAWAVVAASNEFKLPVALRKSAVGSRASSGTRSRLSKAEIEEASEAVLKALPPKNTGDDNCMAIGDIADATSLDADTVKSALGKLKRDEKAASNGKRGSGGGWRRA
jgi:cysteinyl-tRNA synthetase